MTIAVLAANGRSGQAFVEAALAAGHTVRAGVRGGNPFSESDALQVMPCDATDVPQLLELLKGADAVVSLIGHIKGVRADVQTLAMQAVTEAMSVHDISRIVSLTGTGVRQTGDNIVWFDYLLNAAISIIDPARVRDGIEHARILQASKLDYSIIRVLKLTNGGLQKFTLKEHGPTKLFTSRKTVAAAVLKVLEEKSSIRQVPIIGK
jgi:NAD(P)H-binding